MAVHKAARGSVRGYDDAIREVSSRRTPEPITPVSAVAKAIQLSCDKSVVIGPGLRFAAGTTPFATDCFLFDDAEPGGQLRTVGRSLELSSRQFFNLTIHIADQQLGPGERLTGALVRMSINRILKQLLELFPVPGQSREDLTKNLKLFAHIRQRDGDDARSIARKDYGPDSRA